MRNFGINLLATVQTVIGKQQYTIEEWTGRTRNDRGANIDQYGTPQNREGSVQPLEAKEVIMMGLMQNKIYIEVFDLELIKILTRSENPPRINFNGYYWEPIPPGSDWQLQGGWNRVVCVRQGESNG